MPTNSSSMQAVVFDWRGTLVSVPSLHSWAREGLRRAGHVHDDDATTALLQTVEAAAGQPNRLDSADIDTSAALHKDTFFRVFADAGLDEDLSEALYAAASDPAYNTFADDVAPTFRALAEGGCKIGVISDIHFDIRPAFADAGLLDLIDSCVLSYEHGVQKPDPTIFRLVLHQLGTEPARTLMVGDRPSRDGVAIDLGMPTLLVPPLVDPQQRRLHLVTAAVTGKQPHKSPTTDDDRGQHNTVQAAEFDSLAAWFETMPSDAIIEARLDAIVAAGQVTTGTRVLDVGAGVGVLAKKVKETVTDGPVQLWGCEVSVAMAEAARRAIPDLECLVVDITDFPLDHGPFDAVFCNGMFGNVWDQEAALKRCAELLSTEGQVVISHPMGRGFVEGLHAKQPHIVPHTLPIDSDLTALAERSGLAIESVRDEDELYIVVLRRADRGETAATEHTAPST